MSEVAITRIASRRRPDDHLHAESGNLAVGPCEPGWLSAKWALEPVAGSTYFRARNLARPGHYLHAESGAPAVGPIAPGWLSAQWRFEPVADASFVRLVNGNPLVRYAHIESGALDAGTAGPGWLSAQWVIENVPNTSFVRLRNRWKPEQCLHIESGPIAAGPVGPGWLSAQWTLEIVPGTAWVRIRNRWKPSQYFHIESGKPGSGPIGAGWLSAQWQLEKVAGTNAVRLRNRWEVEPCLHMERGVPEIGLAEPGWLSAQWLAGSFRRKVFPLALLQRKLDAFINRRETPLFAVRLHGEGHGHTFLTVFMEDPLTGRLESGKPKDLGQLELPTVGNNFAVNNLNTERVTLNIVNDPGDQTPEVEAVIRFETKGEEIRINNAPNVNLTGCSVRVRVRFGLDPVTGLVRLESFADRVEEALRKAAAGADRVQLRGKTFEVSSSPTGLALLHRDLKKEYVSADVSVDVSGLPDGEIAHRIESALDDKIWDGLASALADDTKRGWTPWASVSEGNSTPGAHIGTIVDDERVTLVLADRDGGIYAAEGNPEQGLGAWRSVSEGSTAPGGHVNAVALGDGRIALTLADRNGGVYIATGDAAQGWSAWRNVSEGSTLPGAPVSAAVRSQGRITLVLADSAGSVYAVGGKAGGEWGGWQPVSEGSTVPGGHITALAVGERVVLFLADKAGGVYTALGSPEAGWSAWRNVPKGSTTPGAPIAAVARSDGRIALFLADQDGGILSASGTATGTFGPWLPVSEGSTTPGGVITASAINEDDIALFIADRNGGIYANKGSAERGWGVWALVSQGRTTPGGHVAAAVVRKAVVEASPPSVTRDDRAALFIADPNGGIYTSRDGAVVVAGIDRRLTRLLVGDDFRLLSVGGDRQNLTIDYLLGEQQLPFPEVAQPPLDPGPLANIGHIVVLMMENRSFDHMLGYLATHGGRADIDGLGTVVKNEHAGKTFEPFALATTRFPVSPRHDFEGVAQQIHEQHVPGAADKLACAMDGFVAGFAERAARAARNVVIAPGDVMGYYQAAQVPVYDALAREFVVCNRWFCSHPGGTFPNRFYATTGRLNREGDGRPQLDNPSVSPIFTRTIFDHLSEQGVSWRYYEHGYCFLRLFERYMFDDTNVVQIDDEANGFFAAARAGTLPSVTFIDPDFIEVPPGADDHAPADIASGQHLIGRIVNALMSGPGWNETLLLVTYDEHGGFYDHVAPPLGAAVSGIGRLGVRVPAIIVSPWVQRGFASDEVFDHTSIIKTISRRFLSARPPDMGARVTQAKDLSVLMRASRREDTPAIPSPPAPAFVEPSTWTRWGSVSEGNSTPGARIGAVPVGPRTLALVVADRAGGIFAAEGNPDDGWSRWHAVSEGSTTPGGHVTAVALGGGVGTRPVDGRVAIALADKAGGVYVAEGSPARGWSAWRNASEGATLPGAPVSAVVGSNGCMTLLLADPAGGVYAASAKADGSFGPWGSVSEGATVPGGHVNAVAVGERIALFIADMAGGVYAASGSVEAGWSAWRSVSEGSSTPGAPIAAVARSGGRITLFLADSGGAIYCATGTAEGAFGPWSGVSEGSTIPGGAIGAAVVGEDRIALFVADRNGGSYANEGSPETGWGSWTWVSEGRTAPGGFVSGVVMRHAAARALLPSAGEAARVALLMTDAAGAVLAAINSAAPGGEGDHDFHDILRAARLRFFL